MSNSIFTSVLTVTLFCASFYQAQAQFFLNGSALATNDSCYQLTNAINSEVGSIWNGDLVSLNESFEVLVDIFVGCQDELGADGMVFGLQPVSTSIGVSGGDIGFGNVQPSLGVEFDTYQNEDYADPIFDHITIIRDGILNHNTPQGALAGPVQANVDNANIEDCDYHPLRITWDADAQTLAVFLDCDLRLTYTGDLVNDIFDGDPFVYWGFTSATGGLNNVHEICFSYTSFLNQLVDQIICPGEEIQLEASGGVSYSWTPTTGLSDPTIANPIASPEETTLYSVEIIDDCGIPFFDDVLITVDNDQFSVNIDVLPEPITIAGPGTQLELNAILAPSDEGNYSYSWTSVLGSSFSAPDSSSTTVILTPETTGSETITVQVISENGCIQEASITISIEGPLYVIPNIFSPNGDGANDVFGVFTRAAVEAYNCKIYNRWGDAVFESDNPTEFWDGTYNDSTAPSDEFIYFISFEIGSLRFEEKGGLTLIR